MIRFAAWTVAVAAVLAFAADTRLGPVVVQLSPTHGVHLGDLVALVVISAATMAFTFAVRVATRYQPAGREDGPGPHQRGG